MSSSWVKISQKVLGGLLFLAHTVYSHQLTSNSDKYFSQFFPGQTARHTDTQTDTWDDIKNNTCFAQQSGKQLINNEQIMKCKLPQCARQCFFGARQHQQMRQEETDSSPADVSAASRASQASGAMFVITDGCSSWRSPNGRTKRIPSERPPDRSTGDKQSDSGGWQRRQRRHPLGYYCQRLSECYLVNLPNSRTLPSNRKLNRLVAVRMLDQYFWVKTICCLCELITFIAFCTVFDKLTRYAAPSIQLRTFIFKFSRQILLHNFLYNY